MKTTVVIPNYNGKHFLQDCLDSLFQSTVEIAVIVVDNGSADGSVSWIQEHFPQVKLICFSENKGFCTAIPGTLFFAPSYDLLGELGE